MSTPGTVSSDGSVIAGIAWLNPTNVQVNDSSYATSLFVLGTLNTQYLLCTNFGFSVPGNAIVRGVQLDIVRTALLGNLVQDNSIKLIKGGTVSGNEKATSTKWTTSDVDASYGGATDLWGLSLLPADVNGSTFGVAISAQTIVTVTTAQINYITLTLFYDLIFLPQSQGNPFVSSIIQRF